MIWTLAKYIEIIISWLTFNSMLKHESCQRPPHGPKIYKFEMLIMNLQRNGPYGQKDR